MPIYDYRCDHCGHAFSAVQSFSDEALAACQNCGKRPRRLLSKPALVFKGSGWYKTDSRGPAPADGADTKAAKTSAEPATTDAAPKAGGAADADKGSKSPAAGG